MGFPEHLIVLLRNLYLNQQATVRTEHGETNSFNIGKGVRQACILSPTLFNLYAERIMREAALDESKDGIRIGGRLINNLRYADDITLAANSKDSLLNMLEKVRGASEKTGLYFNVKKTKVLTTADIDSFTMNGENIDVVKNLLFLGSLINDDGNCHAEIARRVILAKEW